MGRMLRMWRGEWRKSDSQYWHFVPEQTDSGLTLYLEEGEGYTSVEMIVRKHYGIGASTPMVITYGLPDWMVFPSGHTPPLTIGNTTELVELMASRPWMVEFTLFVTLGAKGVAEYYFNRRSPFYIGSSSFVVDHTQDAFARASYEKLVFGKRMVANEEVMKEIFGEEEMVVFYRVAMEMELAEREKMSHLAEQGGPGIEVIRLDDDSKMEEASRVGRMDSTTGGLQSQNEAPAVLWDVGIDFLAYPGICSRDRAAALEASENAFWEGVLHEETKSPKSPDDLTDIDEDVHPGDGPVVQERAVEIMDDDGSSSTNNTGLIGAQIGSNAATGRVDVGCNRTAVEGLDAGKIQTMDGSVSAGCQALPPPDLMLTLACRTGEPNVEANPTKTTEGTTHASENEGGSGKA
ncbi:hypothetical protein Bca52824_023460 [Brassica carinata]|uniref:Uncharacterized protein n=1 Tax=Brassica carinata TaxID=52824 RepID=A0A8X8AUL5_BRACI|nr:hypothetical protein Bca52824_023460 [Brassica carinata]